MRIRRPAKCFCFFEPMEVPDMLAGKLLFGPVQAPRPDADSPRKRREPVTLIAIGLRKSSIETMPHGSRRPASGMLP